MSDAQVSEEAVLKRYNQGWLEEYTNNLDELITKLKQYRAEGKATSIGYHGNVVDLWYVYHSIHLHHIKEFSFSEQFFLLFVTNY